MHTIIDYNYSLRVCPCQSRSRSAILKRKLRESWTAVSVATKTESYTFLGQRTQESLKRLLISFLKMKRNQKGWYILIISTKEASNDHVFVSWNLLSFFIQENKASFKAQLLIIILYDPVQKKSWYKATEIWCSFNNL